MKAGTDGNVKTDFLGDVKTNTVGDVKQLHRQCKSTVGDEKAGTEDNVKTDFGGDIKTGTYIWRCENKGPFLYYPVMLIRLALAACMTQVIFIESHFIDIHFIEWHFIDSHFIDSMTNGT